MSIQTDMQRYFERYTAPLIMRLYTKDHQECFLLTYGDGRNSSDIIEVCVLELGTSVIDFLYNKSFDAMIGVLLNAESYVQKIIEEPDNSDSWIPFYELALKAESHPFYYYLLQEIVNARRVKMLAPDKKPYSFTYFKEIGLSYQRMRAQIQALVGNCFEEKAKSGTSSTHCFSTKYENMALSYQRVYGELVPAKAFEPDKAMQYAITEVLHPNTPEDIASFLFVQYLKEDILYKRCENCQKYFVATGRSNVKYCDREIGNTGKTCRQTAPLIAFRAKRQDSPVEKVFNRAYKTQHSRMSSGRLSKELFKQWSKEARQKRDDCAAGKLTIEDFEKWLAD